MVPISDGGDAGGLAPVCACGEKAAGLPRRRPTYLVVDDEPLIRWSLVRVLEARGLEARSVASAELALALLQEWPVDYLISDIHLPGMDGLELVHRCQRLRRRPGIILVIGSVAPPLPSDLDRLGVLGVIEKPFILDSLAPILDSVLQQPGRAGAGNAGGGGRASP